MTEVRLKRDWYERFVTMFGHVTIGIFESTGEFVSYIFSIVKMIFSRPFRHRLILQQMQFIGYESTFIILLCGFFIGAAVSLQVGTIFMIFGGQSMLGAVNAKALARELSPLMAGFLVAGRAGAAITAEISTMKVNEQIDAMEAMAVDPLSYLVVPRVIACILMVPLLVALFNLTGQLASLVIAIGIFDIDQGLFFDKMARTVSWRDVWAGLQKALVFGAVIGLVCCRYGLSASGGAKGVGQATTNAVVTTLLTLLSIDFFITYLQIAW